MHVLFADSASREAALKHRVEVQDFYQVTQTDAKGKVAPVFDRLFDAYLNYADQVNVYYNTGKYWLCTNIEESMQCLSKFLTCTSEADSYKYVNADKFDDFMSKLSDDVRSEVEPSKQSNILAQLRKLSSPEDNKAKQSNGWFTSFNCYKAAAVSLAVLAAGAAIYVAAQDERFNFTPKP